MIPLDIARAGKQWSIVHMIENECSEVVTQAPPHSTDDQGEPGNRTAVSNLDATDENGMTRLHLAALEGDSVTVQYLINAGANLDAKTEDELGATPLHVTALYDHAEVAEILINAGANPHAKNNNGLTPLDVDARPESQWGIVYVRKRVWRGYDSNSVAWYR